MTELPIDQSNLPRVQEVQRDFSVLEDGALAHCLQEQEIELHYASNVQKNKLVQKDIRIAKKLQDEEDEQNKLRSLEKQRQIEERDLEYARVIQEELHRKAEECRRREEEDKEIAKRLQELEQEDLQRRSHESLARNREHIGLRCHQRCLRETDSEEEDQYYFCQKANNNSPNAGDGRRTQWTPEQDSAWQSSQGRTAGTASASGRIPSRDRSEKRHSDSGRNVRCEARNDRRREHDRMGHRGRTHSWERSERSLGQHGSEEGGCESRPNRSRSLREQGKHQCGDQFSKHHQESHRHSNSKSEDCYELDGREQSLHSHWTPGRQQHTQHSVAYHSSPRKGSHSLRSGDMQPKDADTLEWQMAELDLGGSDQLLRDEELARRLQEEEEKQLTTSRHRGQNVDFRAAQVAQDEEIAKYMQRQELKSRRRSEEGAFRRENVDESSSSSSSSSERRRRNTDEGNEVTASHQVRLDSEGLASPRECSMQERPVFPSREGAGGKKQLMPRNIAEELDPTFMSRKQESVTDVFTGCLQDSPGSAHPHAVPVDGFYDFMDDSVDSADPVFIPPTKRQPDKPGRQKSRDKKENCKQQ